MAEPTGAHSVQHDEPAVRDVETREETIARVVGEEEAAGAEHIFSPEAAAADAERMAWFEDGDHARVLDTMTEFYRYKPEARFGHYLMMIGALGEGDCTARGRRYGEYENSVGTGQVPMATSASAGATVTSREPGQPAVPSWSTSASWRRDATVGEWGDRDMGDLREQRAFRRSWPGGEGTAILAGHHGPGG